jgi:hypothetical protein
MPMKPGTFAAVTSRLRSFFSKGAAAGDATAAVILDEFVPGSDTGLLDADLVHTAQKMWTESKTREERHQIRTRMDTQDSLISASLDIVADVATAPEDEEDSSESFEVKCDNPATLEEAERIVSITQLQERSGEMGRRILQYGNEMQEIVVDDAAAPSRVVRYKLLPEQQMWYRQNAYGIPDEHPWEQRPSWKPAGTGILFEPWQIVHYTYRASEEEVYGRGMLDFEKDWQRLQAIEDGMVQARLSRAYDKYKHMVPVPPGSSAQEQEAYLRRYKDSIQKRQLLSATYGTGQRDNPSSVMQDFYVPHPSKEHDNAGPQLLVGQNPNLQNIRDIEYMRSRVLCKLVPMRYLNIGGAEAVRASLGDGGQSYEDKRFARMVRKLQQSLALGHVRMITYHLILRGLNPLLYPVSIEFPSLETKDRLLEADIDLKRAQALQIVASFLQLPADLVADHYMRLSTDEKEKWFGELRNGMIQADALKPEPEPEPSLDPDEIAAKAVAAANAAGKNGGATPPEAPPPPSGERAMAIRQMAESLLCLTAQEVGLAQEAEREHVHAHSH